VKLSNPRLPFLPNVSSVFNPSRPDTANNYFPVFTVSSTKHVRMNLKKAERLNSLQKDCAAPALAVRSGIRRSRSLAWRVRGWNGWL